MTKTRYTFVEDTENLKGGILPFDQTWGVRSGTRVIESRDEVKEPVVQTFTFTQHPNGTLLSAFAIRESIVNGWSNLRTRDLVVRETTS